MPPPLFYPVSLIATYFHVIFAIFLKQLLNKIGSNISYREFVLKESACPPIQPPTFRLGEV